jgi:hypothetical protein
MSINGNFISGEDLMKQWKISPIDLMKLVSDEKLKAYGNYGTPVPSSIKITVVETICTTGIGQYYFDKSEIADLENSAEIDIFRKPIILNNKARHKERCRALAEFFWEIEPDATIEAIIKKEEINKIGCENTEYTKITLRRWIRDLCDKHLPGRPPKKV